MNSPLLLSVLFALGTSTAYAQNLSLKEYELGAEMATCPATAVTVKKIGLRTLCNMGPTTLANQPVSDVMISLYEGKLIGAMFNLGRGGFSAHSQVREALKEKLGEPTASKPHINNYTWIKGTQLIGFDGYKGNVILMDTDREKSLRATESKSNKSDL